MNRILALVLALACLLSSAALAEGPVVTALISTSQMPAEENSVLTEIRTRTGIDFRPTMVENNSYSEKFNTLAAAGMLPDIVRVSSYSQLAEMIEFGAILPLNDLLASHGGEITANMGNTLSKTIACMDGIIYGIPEQQGRLNALMVRQDWLDTLGLKAPTTLEEFYDVAVAFTRNDPDKDGADDTVALAATMAFPATVQFLFTAYGVPYTSNGYTNNILQDGKVLPYFMHPNYLKAIEFIQKLYSEGLMEPDFSTIANMSCLEKLWNGTYGFYFGDPIGTTNNWLKGGRYTENPQPNMTYTVICNENGVGGSLEANLTSFWVITSGCKEPEAAMDLLNYLCSEEGNALAYAGVEGKHWARNEDGTITYLNEYADSAMQRDDGGYMYFRDMRFDGLERQILNETTRYGYRIAAEHVLKSIFLGQQPEAEKDITFVPDEMLASLVVSTGDIQAEYNAMIDNFLKNGGEKWIEQATAIYNGK